MDSIRIAIALYGSQDQIEEIAGFGDTDIDEIKCKLYGYSGTEGHVFYQIFFTNFQKILLKI